MAYDTIVVLEVWFRSEEAQSRKFNKTKIFQILSHFQIWKLTGHKFDRLDDFLPTNQLVSCLMMVWNRIKVLEVKISKKIGYISNLHRKHIQFDTYEILTCLILHLKLAFHENNRTGNRLRSLSRHLDKSYLHYCAYHGEIRQ